MEENFFNLKWKYHQARLVDAANYLFTSGAFTDCTLASGIEGQYLNVHKIILCACSPYFRALLNQPFAEKHPIIIVKDVSFDDLTRLVEYMYTGNVCVPQSYLANLMKAAEILQVNGLADLKPNTAEQSTALESSLNGKKRKSSEKLRDDRRKRKLLIAKKLETMFDAEKKTTHTPNKETHDIQVDLTMDDEDDVPVLSTSSIRTDANQNNFIEDIVRKKSLSEPEEPKAISVSDDTPNKNADNSRPVAENENCITTDLSSSNVCSVDNTDTASAWTGRVTRSRRNVDGKVEGGTPIDSEIPRIELPLEMKVYRQKFRRTTKKKTVPSIIPSSPVISELSAPEVRPEESESPLVQSSNVNDTINDAIIQQIDHIADGQQTCDRLNDEPTISVRSTDNQRITRSTALKR